MLRLLHTADVHLGARHEDLGGAGAAIRERQHAALRAAVDLALAEHVAAVLIAGDLFDSNTASQRTVDRAVAELARLAGARIRVVILPGDHDGYTRSSVYRAHDLAALAGPEMVSVLTPADAWLHLDALDAVVVGPSGAVRASGPFVDPAEAGGPRSTWRIGVLHATVGDGEGQLTDGTLEASALDFVALGGGHAPATGRAGRVTWAMPGSPEQVVVDREERGTVNLVTLDERDGRKSVTVETRPVGTLRHRAVEVDVAALASQAALVERLRAEADPDVVLDLRLAGDRPDALALDPAGVEDALRAAYLHVRVTDGTRPPLTTGPLPPPETIAGAFIRNVEGRIAELEASQEDGHSAEAAELREVLRLGRRLLAGAEVAS